MCVRVLSWIAAHPDSEPGFVVLVTQLQVLVARMAAVIAEQRDGRVDSRAASARKQALRREALAGPIAHLAEIGKMAAREQHELASIFVVQAHGRYPAGVPERGAERCTRPHRSTRRCW